MISVNDEYKNEYEYKSTEKKIVNAFYESIKTV